MYQFTYKRPLTIAEAVEAFGVADEPSYLGGGHTLLPTLKGRLAAPETLIDLRNIEELRGISVTDTAVRIAAATPHAEVAASRDVRGAIPVLAGLAGSIGDIHVRNYGTIGGSLANNDPAADYPAGALALDAIIHTERREIPAADYFAGLFTTALEEGEVITAITFKRPLEAAYAKFRNPASRYAMAAVFIARFEGGVRVAVTGAGNDGVFRWSAAEEKLNADFTPAALEGLTVSSDDMMGDMHGSSEYRANLVAVMARRAMENMGGLSIKP